MPSETPEGLAACLIDRLQREKRWSPSVSDARNLDPLWLALLRSSGWALRGGSKGRSRRPQTGWAVDDHESSCVAAGVYVFAKRSKRTEDDGDLGRGVEMCLSLSVAARAVGHLTRLGILVSR